MKLYLRLAVLIWAALGLISAQAADPLRVFIRAGIKTHGPNQHDHPRFLGEYSKILSDRGIQVDGGMDFPSASQLGKTDVMVIFAADGMNITGDRRTEFEKFLRRGGGVVVLHDGIVSGDQNEWCKSIVGGAWIWKKNAPEKNPTKWFEGNVGVYFVEEDHPITRGVSNFDWKDEIYDELDMAPDVRVLATSFRDVFSIWPQMWTYEKTLAGGTAPYRAFVSIPGHEYASFESDHYRTLLLRGIAWAGKRTNADEFNRPTEIAGLKYPAGGPLRGSDALRKIDAHPEFNVSLAADENVSEKIMSLDWDPTGRLWVVETPEYPGGRDIHKNDARVKPNRGLEPDKFKIGSAEPRTPRDRISILEDTNGDGLMDKKTVFADGLELPTSLVFYKDGVIVAQAPDILWLRDTNGDGKADRREVLYTGWGTFDTHAVISNFRWGMDGWIYGSVGYTKGDVKSGDGKRAFGRINDGIYRFRPDGSMVEQFSAGACNTWGCEIAPDNEVVYTTATCGEPICHVVIPETFLARGNVGGHRAYASIIEDNKIYPPFKETRQPYVQIDWVNQWTAAAGACIYDGGAWPAKWSPENRYSFFMSEATMHLFHHQFLDPAGATFAGHKEPARKEAEFLTGGSDYWFRPIHSRVGPDGAMYLVDFYNQIAVHNDTRGPAHGARNAAARPDRDHHFTRLYRIQHKEARTLPPFHLTSKNGAQLVEQLSHPNGWVRMTANRLLTENPGLLGESIEALGQLIVDNNASAYARIQALWLYHTLAESSPVPFAPNVLEDLLNDRNSGVRKNAIRVAASLGGRAEVRFQDVDAGTVVRTTEAAILQGLKDSNDRVKIHALMGAGNLPASRTLADAVVAAWPSLNDKWLQSAAVGAAAKDPVLYLEAAFRASNPAQQVGFVPHLARLVGNRKDSALAGRMVEMAARQPASTDVLKATALEALTASLDKDLVPAWSDGLADAMKSLLAAPKVAGSVLPLVTRWDTTGALTAAVKPAVSVAARQLSDASLPDSVRGQVAANLVGVRSVDPGIIPSITGLLGSAGTSEALQKRMIDALATAPEGAVALVPVFSKLPNNLAEGAFGHILKRSESASAFLDHLSNKTLPLRSIGPARIHRLRTHGDSAVARKAAQVLESLAPPETKEKEALITRMRPEVEKPGNLENGHKLFTANCAGCHVFKGEGRNLAPNLTGMGAHGAGELLVHIIDPNRLVEPNFLTVRIENKAGDSFDGIIERENSAELVLRDASQDHLIRIADIKSREATGRSIMPEGFETLTAEGLRDLLSFICADDTRFRMINLEGAFTANSSRGLFLNPDTTDETVKFNRYGLRRIEDVPFDIVSPEKTAANVIVLKGGAPNAWSKTSLPRKTEAKVGVAAQRLHFLGGVAGWGFPYNENVEAMKVTLHFAGGATQVLSFKNGVEFADYNGRPEVPGSKFLNWTTGRGQIRWFSKDIQSGSVIEKMTFESPDNGVAPMIFAVSAETGPAIPGSKPSAAVGPVINWGSGLKTLIVGGGSSHDFHRFFNLADTAMLNASGRISAHYSQPVAGLAEAIRSADVLSLNNNQAFADDASREAVFAHVNAGKGLVLVHPALWYNWQKEWPAYNRELCGGGSRGHDRYGEFEVTVTEPSHPLMKGVPAKFKLQDELYYFEPDPTGTPIQVLATAHSTAKGKTYPMIWTVKHPKTRIACITLGHDAIAHSHPAYQQLLKNATFWSAGQDDLAGK